MHIQYRKVAWTCLVQSAGCKPLVGFMIVTCCCDSPLSCFSWDRVYEVLSLSWSINHNTDTRLHQMMKHVYATVFAVHHCL